MGARGQCKPHGLRPPGASRGSRRAIVTFSGPVPFGSAPAASQPPLPSLQAPTELVQQLKVPALPSLPTFEAPTLTGLPAGVPTGCPGRGADVWLRQRRPRRRPSIAAQRPQEGPLGLSLQISNAPRRPLPADLIDRQATEPHWGSRAVQEQVERLLAEQQGVGALAGALKDLQAAVEQNAGQLARLPEGASAAQVEQLQRDLQAKAQALSAAAQQAAAALGASAPQGNATAGLAAQLPALAGAQWAGYSLQQLAGVAAGVALLVGLSVPGRDDDDAPGGSGGAGGGRSSSSSRSRSGGASGDALPTRWDPEAVAAYYRRRPVLVARRVAEVAAEALAYGSALLADIAAGAGAVPCMR